MAKLTDMQHPVSDRIMTMRIPLRKDRHATLVSAYAPTMANPEENKGAHLSAKSHNQEKSKEKGNLY